MTKSNGVFGESCGLAWEEEDEEEEDEEDKDEDEEEEEDGDLFVGGGSLLVRFPLSPSPESYWVLDTDYVSFAAVYSCDNQFLGKTENGWILTRRRKPKQSTVYRNLSINCATTYNITFL